MMPIRMESDMVKLASSDDNISIIDQLGENESPVVLVNVFTVDPSEADNVLAAWTRDAAFMKRQPGFIWTQLHRGIGNSTTFMNYAVWEKRGGIHSRIPAPHYGLSAKRRRPHLFRKVSVPGICVSG
jgi:quinol monooxygenase YgiN